MKLQPTTPLEVRDQHEAAIKTTKVQIEPAVKDYSQCFEDTMEVWVSL